MSHNEVTRTQPHAGPSQRMRELLAAVRFVGLFVDPNKLGDAIEKSAFARNRLVLKTLTQVANGRLTQSYSGARPFHRLSLRENDQAQAREFLNGIRRKPARPESRPER